MTIPSATSGPGKDKSAGYWQALKNVNHITYVTIAKIMQENEDGHAIAATVVEDGLDSPTHGQLFTELVAIIQVIETTYGVPLREIEKDLDMLANEQFTS
tara:strand:- start:262 stop:561 length:300 start_codon:yes stop_codon:yes gene_type:complete